MSDAVVFVWCMEGQRRRMVATGITFGVPVGLHKLCTRCKRPKPIEGFRERRKLQPNGTITDYRNSYCHSCDLALAKEYADANREMKRTNNREYMRRRTAAMSPEEYETKVLAPARRRGRRLQQEAPEILRARVEKRRCREANGPGVTAADIKKIVEGQKRRCWWCGCKLGERYHMDHRIPLARGGEHGPGNIVAACPSCNSRKQARMPWDFAGRLL